MKIFLIFFLVFFSALSYFGLIKLEKKKEPYVTLAQELRRKVGEDLAKKYNMKIVGITGGLSKKINLLGLGFDIIGPKSKEELRKILVDGVLIFLQTINTNEGIRPYLKNFPFTPNNLSIDIFVVDKDGKAMKDPFVTVATAYHNQIQFLVGNKDSHGYASEQIENFEDALKIVNRVCEYSFN